MPEVDVLKISNEDAAFVLGKNGKTKEKLSLWVYAFPDNDATTAVKFTGTVTYAYDCVELVSSGD